MKTVRKSKTIVLHHCNACDNKWEAERRQFSCPTCKYMQPKTRDSKLNIIDQTIVHIDENGRVLCTLYNVFKG